MKTGKRMGNDPFKAYKALIVNMEQQAAEKHVDSEPARIQESPLAAVIDSREINNKLASDSQQLFCLLNELNQNLKELKQQQQKISLRQDLAEIKNARDKYLATISKPWQIWFPWLP